MRLILTIFLLILYSCSVFAIDTDNLSSIESKKLYLSYKTYPKRVFTNQRFSISLKAVILHEKDNFNKIITTFSGQKNLQIITQEPKWIEKKNNMYETKIELKAQEKELLLPTITMALFFDDEIVDYIVLNPIKIQFGKIAINQKLFSNIIASSLDILQINTKQYNNNSILATIVFEATNSNLEDIHINGYEEQGIESYNDNGNTQHLYYHIVVPIHKKSIKFTYYNTVKKDFILHNLDLTLKEELISTQTNINPYNSNILLYKKIVVVILFSTFLILFLIKRSNIYLVINTILLILLTYLFIPNKKIVLNKGTKIYILPTKSSTVFKIINKKELVEIINQQTNFTKVLLENQNIGWIKNAS